MAYVPSLDADVFISYAHADDFGWIERLKLELESALTRKLRASTKPKVFLDREDVRAGRVFDRDIPDCLRATGFLLAVVSQRYNTSPYCRHEELGQFLKYYPAESGRTIQIHLDLSAALPLPQSLAVPFANAKGPLDPGSDEYKDSLRKVFEPIVHELDRLYAQSKVVFLAWPALAHLKEERAHLQSEIEGRGLRIYPEVIAGYEDDVRLRDALQESAASVHFFGSEPDNFAERQFQLAIQVGKPTIVASRERGEVRRGLGFTTPVWLDQGNPTITIANVLDTVLGRSRREERNIGSTLGKKCMFLVFNPEVDHTLALRLRQRIVNRGPFEVLEPRRTSPDVGRYEDLSRAQAAIMCWGRADKQWFVIEWDALIRATVGGQLYDIRRAVYLKSLDKVDSIDLIEGDRVLRSDDELDTFLNELHRNDDGVVA